MSFNETANEDFAVNRNEIYFFKSTKELAEKYNVSISEIRRLKKDNKIIEFIKNHPINNQLPSSS